MPASDLPNPVFTFDQVMVFSDASPQELRRALPIMGLSACCPAFRLRKLRRNSGSRLQSCITFTATPDPAFWQLLLDHEANLGRYYIGKVELAFDHPARSEFHARTTADFLGKHLRKPWHSRQELKVVGGDTGRPHPNGVLSDHTVYFEDRNSRSAIKVYARYGKHPGTTDTPFARVEWTLRGSRNIRDRTGIECLADLTTFDPTPFFRDHFRLEEIDYAQLGRLLTGSRRLPRRCPAGGSSSGSRYGDPYHGNGLQYVNSMAARDRDSSTGDGYGRARHKWHSAAHVRGSLKRWRRSIRDVGGPRTPFESKIANLTDYRIDTMFRDITPDLVPVRLVVCRLRPSSTHPALPTHRGSNNHHHYQITNHKPLQLRYITHHHHHGSRPATKLIPTNSYWRHGSRAPPC